MDFPAGATTQRGVRIEGISGLFMIDYIKYRLDLRELLNQRYRIERSFNPLVQKAHQAGKREERDSLLTDKSSELLPINIDISRLILKEASRLMILPPERDDEKMWQNLSGNLPFLTEKGAIKLRSDIQRRRREAVMFWFSLLFGLISSVTALIAILYSC